MTKLADIMSTYQGSDGDRTKALYAELEAIGPIGVVAVNLFRACKSSERAKTYRGGERGRGSYRSMGYARKDWALCNLTAMLDEHAEQLGIAWGWGVDDSQPFHKHVLYVDLPAGQVSFHTAPRGHGPAYPGEWDGQRGASAGRVCQFCAQVLAAS